MRLRYPDTRVMVESSIASEIDAIIARALEEYQAVKGIGDNPLDPPAPREPEPEPEVIEIPANSQSVLVSEETSRFSSAIWFDNIQSQSVTIAGLGGIGSYVAFLIGRFHPRTLFLYDPDTIEVGNMSGQLYSAEQVGLNKAAASANTIYSYANNFDVFTAGAFDENSVPTRIFLCGFDTMVARRTAYSRWKSFVTAAPEEDKKNWLFIDGRLAAESFQVLCIKGDETISMERYEREFLFTDAQAEETVCSYKQTSFMANMIASVMVNLFVNFCANQCDPLIPRDLPFYTEYTAETMFFKVVQ